jgi:hypothetical protein
MTTAPSMQAAVLEPAGLGSPDVAGGAQQPLECRLCGLLRRSEADGALPAALVEQRLSIFSIYANAILSAREAAEETRKNRHNRLWDQRSTIENILDTLEAAMTGPPSAPTLAILQADAAGGGPGLP